MSPEAEKTVKPPVLKSVAAQEFYFPAGGGADPDFFLPARRKSSKDRFRWLKWRPFGRRRSARESPAVR